MRTETIVKDIEAAKGLVRSLLEDEEITDFEIWSFASGECKVVAWFVEK